MIHFFPLWEIYSLRSNFWRELVINMPHSCLEQTYSQVYMDGTCLWLSISENQTWEECLVSFDLSNEVFHISILGELGVKASWTKFFIVGPLPCVDLPIGVESKIDIHPIRVGMKGNIFFKRKDDELILFDKSPVAK
ncbi:hypothetical protein D0Y65_012012, partial [Glycine soja]